MTKITNAMALVKAIEVLGAIEGCNEYVEKLENMRASLEKKNSHKSDKPTARQTENEVLKNQIVDFLSNGAKATVTDLIKGVPTLSQLSNQRVSAIVRQLVTDNTLHREEIKRRAYFSLNVGEEVDA